MEAPNSNLSVADEAQSQKPLCVSIRKARELLDVGNTTIWKLVKDGRLRTISIGRKRLVIYASLELLLEQTVASVPPASPRQCGRTQKTALHHPSRKD